MIKKFKVLGKIYNIIKTPAADDSLENGQANGRCHLISNNIYIADDLNVKMELEVFTHEILHALDSALVLNLNEEGVKRLGEGLLALIIDNELNVIKNAMLKKIKVLGKTYNIIKKPIGDDLLDNGRYRGRAHLVSNNIYIANALNTQMELEAVIHEILYTLDDALVLGLDEDGTKRLSEGLLAIIVDNKLI